MSNELFDKTETLEREQSGNPGWFEHLVETLAIAIRESYSGGAEHSTESDMRRARKDARTVLAELAKMGADDALVSAEELASMLWAPFATPRKIHGRLREQAAPILAAKDAEIERLRAVEATVVTWMSKEMATAEELLNDPELTERQLGASKKRMLERLKTQLDAQSANSMEGRWT